MTEIDKHLDFINEVGVEFALSVNCVNNESTEKILRILVNKVLKMDKRIQDLEMKLRGRLL